MTGEITLRGLVLQVGGLKEKLLAAKRNGMKEVVIPKMNEKDLPDVPDEIKKQMTITPVERLDEIIPIALCENLNPLTAEEIEDEIKKLAELDKTPPKPDGTGSQGVVSTV